VNPAKRKPIELALIVLLCAAPVAASYLAYYFWPPQRHVNHGELLDPRPLPDAAFSTLDGGAFHIGQLKGKWVMLMVDSGACDAWCSEKLYDMRQVRLTQGKDSDRIERVWLIDDGARPAAELGAQYAGTWFVDARASAWLERLPVVRSAHDHIYLIDPLGNLMMRYPRGADAEGFKKDITRLLRVSRIG